MVVVVTVRGTKLRFGPWGYISRGVRSPCKVRVIPPIENCKYLNKEHWIVVA